MAQDLHRAGYLRRVPVGGAAWGCWPGGGAPVEMTFHVADLDFRLGTVTLSTGTISFEDLRRLFYAMVAGREAVPG